MTDAGSITARSSGASASSRAATRAWTVGGIARSARLRAAPQRSALPADRAGLHEHRHDLLDVQRIALGAGRDPRSTARLESRRAAGRRSARVARRVSGSSVIVSSACASRPFRVALDELVARRAQQQDRRLFGRRQHVVEEVEERLFRPVDVVDDTTSGPLAASASRSRRAPHDQLGDRERGGRQAHRRGDAVDDRARARPAGGFDGASAAIFAIPSARRVVLGDRRRPRGRLGQRPERDAVAVREAAAPDQLRLARRRVANSRISRVLPTPASPTTVISRARAATRPR